MSIQYEDPVSLQKRYDATIKLLIDLFTSDDEEEIEKRQPQAVIVPQSAYLGASEAGAIPACPQAASCSLFRIGERQAPIFTILGLMLMLFGSCGTVAVGASTTAPATTVSRSKYVDDPFTTMNGYGDRVY